MHLKPSPLLLCLVYVTLRIVQAYQENKVENALRLLQQLSNTRQGISALKRVVNDIDEDLQKTQKRTCLVGGGMSQHCATALVDSKLDRLSWLKNGMSPGKKRSDPDRQAAAGANSDKHNAMHSKLKDISRKRKGLDLLKRILGEMDADLIYEQKRSCQVNLGGHCATESAAAVADQWHYLNSPMSPGRKRRDTQLYKKLISGKLLQ